MILSRIVVPLSIVCLAYSRKAREINSGVCASHAEQAGHGEWPVSKAKLPMPYEMYSELGGRMLEVKDGRNVLAHTVLTTMWNLMCRVYNTMELCVSHLQ